MLANQLSFDDIQRPEFVGDIVKCLQEFTFNGETTRSEYRNGIPFLFNEFWTSRQRQSNSIHEISYRACFKAQLPEFFVERMTRKGDVVYDPFMGRGTTLVQAALMGRSVVGNDINPLSVYLCRPRISPPNISQIISRLNEIDWTIKFEGSNELLVFYHPDTLRQILILRRYLLDRETSGQIDEVDDWIRMVALNRLTGHSTGFFSVYSLPPNQAVSIESQRKINEKRAQVPPIRDIKKIIIKKCRSLLKDGTAYQKLDSQFCVGSADHTPSLQSSSVSLVVTSPPFLDIVQYASDNWLRCWFSGVDSESLHITHHRKSADWTAFIRRVFIELSRIVKIGGYIAFEVGEVRGKSIYLEDLVIEAVKGLPVNPLCVMVNVQEFTKTANCWGVNNNQIGTNTNRIVILERIDG